MQEIHFSFKDTYKVRMKGWKITFQASVNQKKAGLASYSYIRQNRF